jgi:hypothetical protein
MIAMSSSYSLLSTAQSSKWRPGSLPSSPPRRTDKTGERPHGVRYAIVLRLKAGGAPWVRFDNAHGVRKRGHRRRAYDHWHRGGNDRGSPYHFTNAMQLLDDFWAEVKRTLDEKRIPNDL